MYVTQFKQLFNASVVFYDKPLKEYTYTKTGGCAEILVFPQSLIELKAIVQFAQSNHVPLTVLGNASNVIVTDGGLKGIVVMLERMNDVIFTDTRVTAYAGMTLVELSKQIQQRGLTGFEFACGIPGSVGGAVYMNAGAYDGEMKDIIVSVDVLTRQGEFKTYTNEEMQFSYRHSVIQETQDIVVSVTLQLAVGNQQEIDDKIAHLTFLRASKQPLEYPSCGSVFKRPPGHFAGQLIQEANLQGYRVGGVEVSQKHAGFMVNIADGTASDYQALIQQVQQTVYDKFGIELETEVRFIGE